MPSSFDTLYNSVAHAPLQSRFGETVSYTPTGGAASSISAIVERGQMRSVSPQTGIIYEYELAVWVSTDDVAALTVGADTIAAKRRVTDASNTTFVVKALDQQSGSMLHLILA